MIRINLLATERKAVKAASKGFEAGQKMMVLGSLILVLVGRGARLALLGARPAGGRDRSQHRSGATAKSSACRKSSGRCASSKRARRMLQQRVDLIDDAAQGPERAGAHDRPGEPRAARDDLADQLAAGPDGYTLTIQGRCLTLTSLSDFIGNLEGSRYFIRPVEIVESTVVPGDGQTDARSDLVHHPRHVPDGRHRIGGAAAADQRRRRREASVANPVSGALAKLPWYGQIGVFVVLSRDRSPAPSITTSRRRAQEAMAARQAELERDPAPASPTARRWRAGCRSSARRSRELEARLEVLKPILPTDRDAGDLLRRVQTLAVQSNLTILGFRPQAITLNEIHAEWPISLQLEGNYHNLGVFLDRVSKFPRIINIGAMNLAAKSPPEADASMNIGVTATTFVLTEPDAARRPSERTGSAGKEMTTNVFRLLVFVVIAAGRAATARAQAQPPASAPAGSSRRRRKPRRKPICRRRRPTLSTRSRAGAIRSSASSTAAPIRAPRGQQQVKRAEGVPGLMTSEITVRGIVQTRGGLRGDGGRRGRQGLFGSRRRQACRRRGSAGDGARSGDSSGSQRPVVVGQAT